MLQRHIFVARGGVNALYFGVKGLWLKGCRVREMKKRVAAEFWCNVSRLTHST
jgi:hypothetical protein